MSALSTYLNAAIAGEAIGPWLGAYALPAEESADDLARLRAELDAKIRPAIRNRLLEKWEADGDGALVDVLARIDAMVADRVRRGTAESWSGIRSRIYKRDSEVCHPCGFAVSDYNYECGHIIDRAVGGHDRDSNLVVMCWTCNQAKPLHTTRGEYLDWVATRFAATLALVRSGAHR